MPLHITFVCDVHKPHRDKHCAAQVATFDRLDETFSDLLVALRATGWRVRTDDANRVVACVCPEHASPPVGQA